MGSVVQKARGGNRIRETSSSGPQDPEIAEKEVGNEHPADVSESCESFESSVRSFGHGFFTPKG